MPTVTYYSDWRTRTWTCDCGWSGTGDDASSEPFAELLQVDCPTCQHRICLVPYPTEAETAAAAADGHPEALRALEQEAKRAEWEKRLRRSKLYRTAKLPALDGVERIEVVLSMDQVGDDAVYTLIANGELIHSEVAEWESIGPLPRLLRHLKARYGERLVAFSIAPGAWMYLAGDSLALGRQIDAILEEAGFPDPSAW